MSPHELIEGHARVAAAFGGVWPSFHDAEVHSISLERATPTGALPTLQFVVHAWNMTDEVTAEGYYRLTHHHLVEFLFLDVTEVQLDGFNHQNVLSDIIIESNANPEEGFRVELEHCFGVSASFDRAM
jgi:hypothetical protein